jgi:transketolase
MEKTIEKSQEQANIILALAFFVQRLDIDYLREAEKDFIKQASWQESAAILNPSYPLEKNEVLREQANALKSLCDYADSLKKIDELNKKIALREQALNRINRNFV